MASAPEDEVSTARWRRVLDSRATRERGRRTLAKLLDAAVAEFSAYGYHAARVARVAQRARTSHGTFYVYFQGKDDLLVAMQEELIAEIDEVFTGIPELEPGPEGYAALRAWLARLCEVYVDHAPIRSAIFDALVEDADPRIGKVGLRAQRKWTMAVAERIRRTGTSDLDPYLAAVCIDNLLDRATRSMQRGQLVVTFDELVDGLTELIHRSVFGASTPATPRRQPAQ